jgi:hypothetical protein
VRLTVELDPPQPRLSDEARLAVTIDAAEGVKVRRPPFGEAVGSFSVLDFSEPVPEIRDGRQIIRQIYKLEPMSAGEVTIAPIPVTFEDARPDGDGKEHTIESEPITVTVTSMVADEVPGLDSIAPVEGPLPLPAEPGWPWPLAVAGLVVVGALAWLALRRRRARRVEEGPRLSPGELAYLELQRLLEDDPIGRGEIQTFYVELTLIVRRYIERTRGIRAPEQTTGEFLREMQSSDAFTPEERERLKAFLESADMVKFAAVRPTPEEIEASFERAKEFVGQGSRNVRSEDRRVVAVVSPEDATA